MIFNLFRKERKPREFQFICDCGNTLFATWPSHTITCSEKGLKPDIERVYPQCSTCGKIYDYETGELLTQVQITK